MKQIKNGKESTWFYHIYYLIHYKHEQKHYMHYVLSKIIFRVQNESIETVSHDVCNESAI